MAYDGSPFAGWAVQPGERTVEGELRAALATVLREPVALTVAGRTDRGVHALGQVVSYEGELPRLRSVNALLPPEIAVLAAERAPGRLLRPPRRPQPLLPLPDPRPQRALAVRARPRALAPVSVRRGRPARVRRAAARASTTSPPSRRPTATTGASSAIVLRAGWERRGDVLEFSIEADSFMRNMNRVLVGTMLELAGGRGDAGRLRAPARGPPALGGRAHRARRTGSTWSRCGTRLGPMLRVLLTNDDGIGAKGLQTLRRALLALEDVELAVVAPDSNRSATARSITFSRPLWVTEVGFEDGTKGYACDGTPVDCVRLAALGLIDGFQPDLVVSGHQPRLQPRRRHHLLRAPSRPRWRGSCSACRGSRSPSSRWRARWTSGSASASSSTPAAAFVARIVDRLDDVPLPEGTLLNINVPAGDPDGVEVARLGKRIYRTRSTSSRRRTAAGASAIYGDSPVHDDEPGTDLAAVSAGRVSVTPLHFDLTAEHGLEALRAYDLAALLQPAAEEVAE